MLRLALLGLGLAWPCQEAPAGFEAGFASITEDDLRLHVTELAAPQLEGRDSPSSGLTRAGDYLIARMQAAGVESGVPDGSYRLTYTRTLPAPVPERCVLTAEVDDGERLEFALEQDFVPYLGCSGRAEGRLSFFGFGITESGERYDDLKGKNCNGEIVLVLEGEPRHKKLFEGPTVTRASDANVKIKELEQRGARGVLLVRRPPAEAPTGRDGAPVATVPLSFRHGFLGWRTTGPQGTGRPNAKIPVAEITLEAASRLLGEDVAELALRIDSSGKPLKKERKDLRVSLELETEERPVPVDNVLGLVRGSDPALAGEYLVLGAHYDHIGVDSWGRIGCGADDNGSGSAGLLELAEAFARAKPRRSVLLTWFSAEEYGMVGSAALVEHPPVPTSAMVAMLNVDMIGRLEDDLVWVIGTQVNPALGQVLKAARKLADPQLKKVVTDKGMDLWERSDHYSFHAKGVPALFFTEGPDDSNPDYHLFTDTVERLSVRKMARITRLMFNTAWLITADDERPPRPH